MQITLVGVQIQISDLPNGGKLLSFIEVTDTGHVLNAFNIPLDANGVNAICTGLRSGIAIANAPLKPVNGRKN